jgi:hypothetical protein
MVLSQHLQGALAQGVVPQPLSQAQAYPQQAGRRGRHRTVRKQGLGCARRDEEVLAEAPSVCGMEPAPGLLHQVAGQLVVAGLPGELCPGQQPRRRVSIVFQRGFAHDFAAIFGPLRGLAVPKPGRQIVADLSGLAKAGRITRARRGFCQGNQGQAVPGGEALGVPGEGASGPFDEQPLPRGGQQAFNLGWGGVAAATSSAVITAMGR